MDEDISSTENFNNFSSNSSSELDYSSNLSETNQTLINSTTGVQMLDVIANGGFIGPISSITSPAMDKNLTIGLDNTHSSLVQSVLDIFTIPFGSSLSGFNNSTNSTSEEVIDVMDDSTSPFSNSSITHFKNSTLDPIVRNLFNITPMADIEISGGDSVTSSTLLDTESDMLSTPALICVVIPLSLISLTIILGNLLVILAVFTQRSLRTPQNIYIVSLASADMAVGVLILPINIAYLVLNRWFLGHALCELWLVTDVSLCTVSIFHLCAIAVDRYRAITDGINYVQKRNLRSVLWTILFIWILAFWIGSPPILGWKDKDENGKTLADVEGECMLPTNVGYVFHLALGALLFPLFLMGFIYLKIFFAIRGRLRERSKVCGMELTSEHDSTDLAGDGTMGRGASTRRKPSEQINSFLVNKQKFSLSRERKAARTLGIIMGAFIICWLPLGMMNMITAIIPEKYNPNVAVFHVVNWLGYVNSALNPIIYAVSNAEFQKGFKRLLHLS